MPNEVEEEKSDEPGIIEMVSLPALMRSASSVPATGYLPY